MPFYKALLRINPLHPGANHELLHFYENVRRPALGWCTPRPSSSRRRASRTRSTCRPTWPRAWAAGTRPATARPRHRLERAYHKEMNVRPQEDQQYSHHLEILTLSLIHDGRYAEARAIKAEAERCGYRYWLPWFRLHVGERDWAAAFKIVEHFKKDKTMASYLRAVIYLHQGDVSRAAPEVEVLRQAYQKKKRDRKLELRLWETQGLLLCLTGAGDAGVKLLERAVQKTKNDYSHHAWGNGAYYMEVWGTGGAGRQAGRGRGGVPGGLAHDPGSVRAALGLQVVCERLNRSDERGATTRCEQPGSRAAHQDFEAELAALRQPAGLGPKTSRLDRPGAATTVSTTIR